MAHKISGRIQETGIALEGHILEMAVGDASINVPVDPRIDVAVLTADDPSPMFVNVETIRTGVSKVNRRRYSNRNVEEVNTLTPGVQGFLGHPDPQKTGFEFRDPHCIYVGSLVQNLQGGGSRAVAKAYLFKSSPLREWVPKSIAAGKPMTVSINGFGDAMQNMSEGTIDVLTIKELESIDWANPGTEGMGTSQAMSVVSEMQNNNQGGNEDMTKEIIANATITEFKAYNQAGYNGIIAGLSLTELQANNPKLVEQIQESAKITEMQLVVGGKQQVVKFTELQGTIDGIVATKDAEIALAKAEVAKIKLTEYKGKKMLELIPTELHAKVADRVVGNTEAEIDASINKEVTYLREMMGTEKFDNMPKGVVSRKDGDNVMTDVQNLFGVKKEYIRNR